jgi:hypothetical protein
VQIEVKSIGLNRAEVMFRRHAYAQEAHFPMERAPKLRQPVKTHFH